jgi:hypothetical protein
MLRSKIASGAMGAGQIDLAFGTMTTHLPLLKSEKAYVLASDTRPTVASELGLKAE